MTSKSANPTYIAQDILSRRDHSEYELRQKLMKKGIYGSELEEVVAWVKTKKYLNDEATTRHYIESVIGTRAVGRRYIQHKLQQKRIATETIKTALDDLMDPDKEKELAQKAASSWKKAHPKHAEDRLRLSRFLLSRGFSGHLVQEIGNDDSDRY